MDNHINTTSIRAVLRYLYKDERVQKAAARAASQSAYRGLLLRRYSIIHRRLHNQSAVAAFLAPGRHYLLSILAHLLDRNSDYHLYKAVKALLKDLTRYNTRGRAASLLHPNNRTS